MLASSDSEVDVETLATGPSEATPSSTPFPSLRIVPCSLPFNNEPIKKKLGLKSMPLSKGRLINKGSPLTKRSTRVTSVPLTNGLLVNKRLSSLDEGTGSLDRSREELGKKRKRNRGTELEGNKNKKKKIMGKEKENRETDEDRDIYVTEEERRDMEEKGGAEEEGDTCMEEERGGLEEERDVHSAEEGESGGDTEKDREEVCSPALVPTDLLKTFPGRQYQIDTLLSIMRKPSHNVTPFVFIHGVQSTGKSSIVKSLLSILKVRHCYIDMKESYSNRLLFESILNQLTGVTPSRTNKYTGYSRCDSLTSFVTQLKSVLSRDNGDLEESAVIGEAGDTVYIVIDNAEVLRGMDETLLPALIRLPELTRSNVCVILISFVIWKKFSFTTGMKTPFELHFTQYSKDNVIKILSNNLTSSKYSSSFIQNYSNIIWNMVSSVSRDLKDLLYISNIFFPLYCQPVEQGQVSETASRKLWSHIEPHFKAHISKLILRDRSSETHINEILTHKQVTCRSSELLIHFPVSVKYLLIASYLASHNPLSTDKRFFSKRKQKKRRHENMNKKKREEIKRYLLGPKSHPLDRLMAIYHSITNGDNNSNPNVFSQVETLVSLKCLSRTGGTGSLDSVKYRCLLSFEQISAIAKSIDFEIVRYLHDYNIM